MTAMKPLPNYFNAGAKQTLHIVSGSENKVLEPLIEQFANKKKINVVMDYQGSLDIMRLLDQDLRDLLSGVERSSGSSDWLKDLYLAGDYDSMVNYEALIISANQTLEAQGKEPLYVIYPRDGLTIADSPLGFISDNGQTNRNESEQEAAFLLF